MYLWYGMTNRIFLLISFTKKVYFTNLLMFFLTLCAKLFNKQGSLHDVLLLSRFFLARHEFIISWSKGVLISSYAYSFNVHVSCTPDVYNITEKESTAWIFFFFGGREISTLKGDFIVDDQDKGESVAFFVFRYG